MRCPISFRLDYCLTQRDVSFRINRLRHQLRQRVQIGKQSGCTFFTEGGKNSFAEFLHVLHQWCGRFLALLGQRQ